MVCDPDFDGIKAAADRDADAAESHDTNRAIASPSRTAVYGADDQHGYFTA
jgi:hypothetical protein